jgi:hypothetical protein
VLGHPSNAVLYRHTGGVNREKMVLEEVKLLAETAEYENRSKIRTLDFTRA